MPDDHSQPATPEEVEAIRFTRPDSYVVSVRLNREESKALTDEARRVGEKLSTFIKAAALEACNRRKVERSGVKFEIGGSDSATAWTLTQSGGANPSAGTTHADLTPPRIRLVS